MAGKGAWPILLAVATLAGCQFASAPPSVAPGATPGRGAAVANTATPTRLPPSPPARTPTAALRTATAPAVRSPTPTGPAPSRTAAVGAPTLGRAGPTTAPAGGASGANGMLPPGQQQLTGDVTNFAASARVMLVRVDGDGERQVSLAESAAIKHADGRAASPAELRPGQRIRATGRGSGDAGLIADEVVILGTR